MILALEILGGWFALSLLLHSILAPWLARRFAKHDEWVEQQENLNHCVTASASASSGHPAAGDVASGRVA